MKRYQLLRMLALVTVLAMITAFSACSGSQKPTEAPAEAPAAEAPASEAPAEAPAAEAPEAPAAPAEAPAEAPQEAPAETAKTISYPIEGGYTLTMVQNLRNHAAAVLGGDDFSAQYCYKALEEKTGVKIEFQMIAETAFSEQINLLIASQDYPDIFGQGIGSYDDNPAKAIEDDVVMDISELVVDYAPDFYAILQSDKDFADQVYNSDGSLCKITSRNIGIQSQGLFIRGDWLDKLGMEVPTTVSELTDVLEAFHTEFGATMSLLVNVDLDDGLAGTFDHSNVGLSRQMLGFQQTAPDSGVIINTCASEGYIEHLTLLRDYYARGIINEDFLNISKENGNFESSYYSGVCGVWQDGCEVADPSYAENASDPDWQAVPMLTPTNDGKETHMSSFTATTTGLGSSFISATCAHPDVALEFMNYGFTEEGKDLVAFGIEGETYTVESDGSIAYTELLTGYADGVRSAEWLYLVNSWMPTDQQQRAINMKYTSELAVDAWEMWTEAAKAGDDSMTVPMTVTLTNEEKDTVSQYSGDLCTHFAENSSKYILGEIDEAAYRASVEDAKALGLTTVTEVYQTAFDRYMEENA